MHAVSQSFIGILLYVVSITPTDGMMTKNNRSPSMRFRMVLTHWGSVTHICISKLTNGLSHERRQAMIWTNDGILLIGPLWTNFSGILIESHIFSFKKRHLKMSSAKWHLFYLGLNELTTPNPSREGRVNCVTLCIGHRKTLVDSRISFLAFISDSNYFNLGILDTLLQYPSN